MRLRTFAMVCALALPGIARADSGALIITFVCKGSECAKPFENDVLEYIGCGTILSDVQPRSADWRWPLNGEGNLVVRYAPSLPDKSTSALVKFPTKASIQNLHSANAAKEVCRRLDKYDNGDRTVFVGLFELGQYQGLDDSTKRCLSAAKKDLPPGIGWCYRRNVEGVSPPQ